ncbi:MAG TPA: response regulator transcription factor [Solirubrobacteraceae bacterium]|nr:response regulator transcription factor [Solirubrobacteraceae bacterium]
MDQLALAPLVTRLRAGSDGAPPAAPARVLVVDDDPAILRTMDVNLRARGYEVLRASGGREALAVAARGHPSVVVLDLGLPDMDGVEVIEGLRGWTTLPIIVLSARAEETEKVAALDAGANDYVTKPFGIAEFVSRLRAALRVAIPRAEDPVLATADFTLDLSARRALRAGEDVRLTTTEWQIVEFLARNPGRLVTTGQLLERVWGIADTKNNYVRVYLSSIRRKLEPDPGRPRYFITEPRSGVRFDPGSVGDVAQGSTPCTPVAPRTKRPRPALVAS